VSKKGERYNEDIKKKTSETKEGKGGTPRVRKKVEQSIIEVRGQINKTPRDKISWRVEKKE
jgi:hypothetical protein